MSLYGFKSTVPKDDLGYRAILERAKHKELDPYKKVIGKHKGFEVGLYTLGEGKKRKNKEYKQNAIRNRKTRQGD